MKHAISLGLMLFAIWLLWSGFWPGVSAGGGLLTTLGLVSCAGSVWLVRRMGLLDGESSPLSVTPRAQFYALWLLPEIVKSNIEVARCILSPRLPIRPRVVRVRVGQQTDLGRVIHANSITLVPGTVTIDIEDDEFTVHALTDAASAGLRTGEMDRRVSWIEGRG